MLERVKRLILKGAHYPQTRFTLRFRDTVGHPPAALLEPRPAQMGQQLISENDGRQQGRNRPSQVTQNRG